MGAKKDLAARMEGKLSETSCKRCPLETPDSWCQPLFPSLLRWTWQKSLIGNLGEPLGTSDARECRAPCAGQGPGGSRGKLEWKDLPLHGTEVTR